MKICRRGLYVQVIDGMGTVRACSWGGVFFIREFTGSYAVRGV